MKLYESYAPAVVSGEAVRRLFCGRKGDAKRQARAWNNGKKLTHKSDAGYIEHDVRGGKPGFVTWLNEVVLGVKNNGEGSSIVVKPHTKPKTATEVEARHAEEVPMPPRKAAKKGEKSGAEELAEIAASSTKKLQRKSSKKVSKKISKKR